MDISVRQSIFLAWIMPQLVWLRFSIRQRIAAIKAQCAKIKGWIRFLNCSRDSIDFKKLCSCCSFAHISSADTRKDYYEKNKNVYWVEDQLKGRRLTFVRISFTESNCSSIRAEFITYWSLRLRKRNRSTLTEEDDADMEEFQQSWDDQLPAEMEELPEDTTGDFHYKHRLSYSKYSKIFWNI